MSNEIIKLLDDLGRRFGIAIDWSSENVLPYLKDLMSRFTSYEIMTSIAWIVIAVAGIVGCSIAIYAINKYTNKMLQKRPYSDWNIAKALLIILFSVMIGCFALCIITQVCDIITCYTIPEKMIFEYLNCLLSNG